MNTPCEQDPDLWFSTKAEDIHEAAAACGFCPVKAGCRAMADERGEQYGVWGGVDFSGSTGLAAPTVCQREGCDEAFKQPVTGRRKMFCSRRCQHAANTARAINHGTAGGYRAHQRRGIEVCDPCREANALHRAQIRETQRARRRDRGRGRAA